MKRKLLFPLAAIFLTLFFFSCQPPAEDSHQDPPDNPIEKPDPPDTPPDVTDPTDPPDIPPDVTDPDPGKFTYSLSFPEQVTTASLSVTSDSGVPVAGSPFNVLNNKSGTLELAPGSWTINLNLSLRWGTANPLPSQKGDTVPITAGQTTSRSYAFTHDDFPLILAANAGSGSAYSLLTGAGYGYETPDGNAGGHTGTPHIIQQYDAILQKNVFAFVMHRNLDGNDTGDQTRQRVEIKVDNDNYRGKEGRAFTYRWKFKLPADFAASTEFTHIHQIKNEGGDGSSPVITLTPRVMSNGNKRMQLIYRAPTYNYGNSGSENSPNRYLTGNTGNSLNDFLGEWVQAEESVTYSADPSLAAYKITITRIRDNKTLLSYTHSPSAYAALENDTGKWPFVTWRPTNTYGRPKYGLYRLIWNDSALTNPVSGLKDETILYADFELVRNR